MPATLYTFSSAGKEMLHGGAQITTQCIKCISSSLSVGRVGWIEQRKDSEACICTVTCCVAKKTISTALAKSLWLLNFTTYSAQPSFGYLLFLALGDFVRLNRQSGTKTVMRRERALYLPIHSSPCSFDCPTNFFFFFFFFLSSFYSHYQSAPPSLLR